MHPTPLLLLWLFTHQDLTLQDVVARKADVVQQVEYGRSRGGRPLVAYGIARKDGPIAPERRPALLVVGGLTGFHEATVAAVEHHVRALAEATDEKTVALLKGCVVWLVPRANPDALEAFAGKRDREVRGNLGPVDEDRDGRVDEDPGDDLNGDGAITRMRVKDPAGEWLADDQDPRILRRANAEKGERGAYKVYTEGKDDDGDGEWNEDGVGDVVIDRNFAHDFVEHDPRNGAFPMSEPETRALAEFVLARPQVAIALIYGLDDTLLAEPKVDARTERLPPNGILGGDLPIYREVGESYRRLTGRKGKVADRHDGSLWSWLYCDLGIPALACSLWSVPTDAAAPATASAPASAPAASQPATQPGAGKPDEEAKEERGRLLWCEANGESARFVPWTKVTLEGLGEVEVGGWRPGALVAPPARELAGLLEQHQQFVAELLGWFGRAALADVKVAAKGGDVFELVVHVSNEGRLALRTAAGVRANVARQTRLTLAPGTATLLMGTTHQRVDDLSLGRRQKFTWLLRAPAGTKVKLTFSSARAGALEREVELR